MTQTDKLYAWIEINRPDLHQQLSAASPASRVSILRKESRIVIGDEDHMHECAGTILALLQMKAALMATVATPSMSTTPPDIIRMAREAGIQGMLTDVVCEWKNIVKFAELVAEQERTARQAAQAENADLKARLARSGVEMRKAVRDMREACAEEADSYAAESRTALLISQAIRATPTP